MDIVLSIVIPVFNRQSGLIRLVDSLLASIDYEHFADKIELVVVDDHSAIPVILPDAPIRHFVYKRSEQNLGAPGSRKLGLSLAKGRYVHFHDSDDTFSDSWLKGIMEEISGGAKVDLLITARYDISVADSQYRLQKFVHKHSNNSEKIQKRLIYRNCFGPLGGITFSSNILRYASFKHLSSSQDWQMYLDVIGHVEVIKSLPDVTYGFHVDGDDRISKDPLKKIRGFMQLSRITEKTSIFKRKIRLFYLYTCREHIRSKKGRYLAFFAKHRMAIYFWHGIVWVYYEVFT